MYCDENNDMVADVPADSKKWKNPSTIVFTYTPVEDPAVYENLFKPFTIALGKCLDKKVVFYQVQSNAAEIEAMRSGRLHDIVGLSGFANQRADSLSGGQRQRVGIARAVMQEPSVLLADEPTSSLDPKTSVEIMQLLTDIARARTIPVIVNMHDVELARRFADRIVGMAGGRIVFDGPPAKLSDETLKTIYGGEDWLH
jgi:ABC-type phosphate/phosphonate transport system ATPase subunit